MANPNASATMIDRASFFQRLIIHGVDFLLILFPLKLLLFYPFFQKMAILYRTGLFLMFWYLFLFFLLSFIVVRFGGSVGCLLLGFRICSSSGVPLTFRQSFYRHFPVLVSGVLSFWLMTIFLHYYPDKRLFIDQSGLVELLALYGGWVFVLERFWAYFFMLDLSIILGNAHRRSITDFVSDGYVVRR